MKFLDFQSLRTDNRLLDAILYPIGEKSSKGQLSSGRGLGTVLKLVNISQSWQWFRLGVGNIYESSQMPKRPRQVITYPFSPYKIKVVSSMFWHLWPIQKCSFLFIFTENNFSSFYERMIMMGLELLFRVVFLPKSFSYNYKMFWFLFFWVFSPSLVWLQTKLIFTFLFYGNTNTVQSFWLVSFQ